MITIATRKELRERRWYWIPAIFSVLLFVTLLIRWLPAILNQFDSQHDAFRIVFGDLTLAYRSVLRGLVAYVITVLAMDWLPPISWRHAWIIAIVAVIAEIGVELLTAWAFGLNAAWIWQLAATAIGYAVTLGLSIASINRLSSNYGVLR